MKQYNLSKIMKAAWNIRKNSKGQINFSECLKRAWKVAKNLVSVAAWFIRKKCLPEEMFYERMGNHCYCGSSYHNLHLLRLPATGSKNLPPVGVSEKSSNEPASDL